MCVRRATARRLESVAAQGSEALLPLYSLLALVFMCCLNREEASLCAGAPVRAVELLREARGSRTQLSAMVMPRHASAEAQDVVRIFLDQVVAA